MKQNVHKTLARRNSNNLIDHSTIAVKEQTEKNKEAEKMHNMK